MKKLGECLNPKCKKLSESTEEAIVKVCGNSDELIHNLWMLQESLEKDYAISYEGYVRIEALRAKISPIYDELTDFYNIVSEKDMV
jgi:hypothetical protein